MYLVFLLLLQYLAMLLGGYVDESKTKGKMLPKDIFLRKFVLRDTIPNLYKNSHKTFVFKLEATIEPHSMPCFFLYTAQNMRHDQMGGVTSDYVKSIIDDSRPS